MAVQDLEEAAQTVQPTSWAAAAYGSATAGPSVGSHATFGTFNPRDAMFDQSFFQSPQGHGQGQGPQQQESPYQWQINDDDDEDEGGDGHGRP